MVRIIVCCLLIAGVAPARAQFKSKSASPAVAATGGSAAGPALDDGPPQTHRYQVGFRVTAVGGPCLGLSGTFPLPGEWPEQSVKQVAEDFSVHVRRSSRRTIEGVEQMTFDIPQLPAGEQASALLTFEVVRRGQTAPGNPEELILPKTLPRELKKYLGPSPQIELTNAKIKSLAKELVADHTEPYRQAEALYDGVREQVKIEPGKLLGAAIALKEGQGPREDVTGLFIAACRVSKIPARMVWVTDGCYAEIYLERPSGEGMWIACQLEGEKKQFGTLSDKRVILMKGDNFSLPENKEPQRRVREFFTGKGGRPQLEIVRRLEDNAP